MERIILWGTFEDVKKAYGLLAERIRSGELEVTGAHLTQDAACGDLSDFSFPVIRTDDALFRDAHRFMEQLDVAQYHVFSYSERPGTKALQIPHVVRPEEKHERSQQILALSEAKLHIFYNRYARARRPVLLEHSHTPGIMHGFTDNYIRTEVRVAPDQPDNCIVQAELGPWNAAGDALTATLL